MITWVRKNSGGGDMEEDFEETVHSKYSSFLCSSVLLILMECYFVPSSFEMQSFLGLTGRWWKSKLEVLEKIPLSVSEMWKAKNEARLRAIDKVR
jgi:hypothetical protein